MVCSHDAGELGLGDFEAGGECLEPAGGRLLLLTSVCLHTGLHLVIRESAESDVILPWLLSSLFLNNFLYSELMVGPSYCYLFHPFIHLRFLFVVLFPHRCVPEGALHMVHFRCCVDRKWIFPLSCYVKVCYEPGSVRLERFPSLHWIVSGAECISALIYLQSMYKDTTQSVLCVCLLERC